MKAQDPGSLLRVAPMLDWTDRHCRYFHRLLAPSVMLYTEMVTTGALLHGDVDRHLRFHDEEHPLALQLGGSDPGELAAAAKLASEYRYDEVNLNCGCPSERVQRGSFGACLMAEPELVRDCAASLSEASDLPVTIKHRIGIDRDENYDFLRDFVGCVSQAGVVTFIVHARNAWLTGLSPKENREVPPLRYDLAARLKQDFPTLRFVLNGGITSAAQIRQQLERFDGVMIGREAYHHPYMLALWEAEFGPDPDWAPLRRAEVMRAMAKYAAREHAECATPVRSVVRHVLGLYNGLPGARAFRRVLSDAKLLRDAGVGIFELALAEVERSEAEEFEFED
jgi:tRNA-dihydrouridine synthase A